MAESGGIDLSGFTPAGSSIGGPTAGDAPATADPKPEAAPAAGIDGFRAADAVIGMKHDADSSAYASQVARPHVDPIFGIAVPAALIATGVGLILYEGFRTAKGWRMTAPNPEDDYEFERFGSILIAPMLLLIGAMQAVAYWEWMGAVGGVPLGAIVGGICVITAKNATWRRKHLAAG